MIILLLYDYEWDCYGNLLEDIFGESNQFLKFGERETASTTDYFF